MRWLLIVLLAAAAVGAVVVARRDREEPGPGPAAAPFDMPEQAEFIGSEGCKECHEYRHETWLETAHAYSLREAREDTVAGEFDGRTIETPFFDATPYRRDGAFHMRVRGKDGRPSGDYRVTRIVGRSFEQAYLFTSERGEWRVLPLCWSIERKEWDLTHEVLADIVGGSHEFPKDYDSRNHVFNHGCGQCHATDYDVGHDLERDLYDSKMLEGAVSCESCHGPGSAHAAWRRQERGDGPEYVWPARLVHPEKDLDHRQIHASCGRCHYMHHWRFAIDEDPRTHYGDIAITLNRDGPGFHADGTLSGLSYHGSTSIWSRCYTEGKMSCLHCHRMHGGKKWALKWREDSDRQCAQCHAGIVEDPAPHTKHEPADARCVDCHMPKYLDGVLHFLRDHSVSVPEPELTERYGAAYVPNACTECHEDQSATWAREWREKWWGRGAPRDLVEDTGTVVALRTAPERVRTGRLVEMAQREEGRLFFRLTATARLARQEGEEARAALRDLLADADPEVRQTAAVAVGERPDPAAIPALERLLRDEFRATRVEAAYAMARCGWRGASPEYEKVYREALGMLDRQRSFDDVRTRLCYLADAQGLGEDFRNHWQALIFGRTFMRSLGRSEMIELLQRHARFLAEAGEHAQAVAEYAVVKEALGERKPPVLLFLDSAASLFEIGRRAEAVGNWRYVLANVDEESIPGRIAAARLAALDGLATEEIRALRETVERHSDDPAAGELLRRARYTLTLLGG